MSGWLARSALALVAGVFVYLGAHGFSGAHPEANVGRGLEIIASVTVFGGVLVYFAVRDLTRKKG